MELGRAWSEGAASQLGEPRGGENSEADGQGEQRKNLGAM